MREVWEVVGGPEHAGRRGESGIGVAGLACHGTRRLREFTIALKDLLRPQLERAGVVPFHLQHVAAFLGAPGVFGQDCHAAGDLDDIHHPADGFGLGCVEGLHLATEARRMRDDCRQHVGQVHILCEPRSAVGLVVGILARGVLANELEVFRVLEHDLGRHRLAGRRRRELAEGRLAQRP
ncbi:hypothetical protein D3C71_1468750 [compost metagenome]